MEVGETLSMDGHSDSVVLLSRQRAGYEHLFVPRHHLQAPSDAWEQDLQSLWTEQLVYVNWYAVPH